MKLFTALSLYASTALATSNTNLLQRRRVDAVVEALERENTESIFRELLFSMSMSMPSLPPTPYPTTSSPTPAPTPKATPSPTKSPTVPPSTPAPTKSPTVPPSTPSPTPSPTFEPTDLTEDLVGCETAYVYCEGRSRCFPGNRWGWNINLSGAEVNGELYLDCAIVAGAGQCDLEKGTVVGKLIITEAMVRWEFGGNNAADEFHLYAGTCAYNDNLRHTTNEFGLCDYSASSPGSPGQYTLGKDVEGGFLGSFQFDIENFETYMKQNSPWNDAGYSAFPIGSAPSHPFLTAHAHVCGPSGQSEEPDFARSGGEPTLGTAGIPPGATAVIVLAVSSAFVVVGVLAYRRYNNKRATSSESVSSSSISDNENEDMVDVAL